nr:MAG TPA: hypothetical protein [Caudoviricetes sp.]
MDRATAEQVLTAAIGSHVASLLAPDDITRALDSSRTPDPQGRTPGQSGYIETIDPYWAAAEAVTTIAIRAAGDPQLTRITSEGASFERTPPDLFRMAALLRARSPLGQQLAQARSELGCIEIGPPEQDRYIPRSHAEIGRWQDGLTNR